MPKPHPEPKIATLKKRADFLRLRNGRKVVMRTLILISKRQPEGAAAPIKPAPENVESGQVQPDAASARIEAPPRIGYTVTRRVGNAVVRNRVRRRFREAVRQVGPGRARPGHDYVFIARHTTPGADFAALKEDVRKALERASQPHRSRQQARDGAKQTRNRPQEMDTRPARSGDSERDSKGGA